MPTTIYGLEVTPNGSNYSTIQFSFNSSRAPVWGDFYIKQNESLVAWNAGFNSSGNEPGVGPCNGSVGNFILRPDTATVGTPTVPEPMSIFLGIIGLTSVAGIRKLRTR